MDNKWFIVLFQDLITGILDRDEGDSSLGHDEISNFSLCVCVFKNQMQVLPCIIMC